MVLQKTTETATFVAIGGVVAVVVVAVVVVAVVVVAASS